MGDEKKYIGFDQLKYYDTLIKNYVNTKNVEHIDDYTYIDDNGSTVSLGGLPMGWKPDSDSMSVSDVLYLALHPYVAPSVVLTGTGEKVNAIGENVHGCTLTVNIIRTSQPIINISFMLNGSVFYQTSSYPSGGSVNYVYGATFSTDSLFQVVVTDGISTVTSNLLYSFIPYSYCGSTIHNITEIDNDTILSMNKKVLIKGTNSIEFSQEDQYCVWVCPTSYGLLSHIYDQNGFDVSSGFSHINILINNISYYVYMTNNKASLKNFFYRFMY